MTTNLKKTFLTGMCALIGGTALWLSTGHAVDGVKSDTKPAPAKASVTISRTPIAKETKAATSFAPVVKKVGPAVVNIHTSKTAKLTGKEGMNSFEQLFGRRGGPRQMPAPYKQRSLGSGVVVTADGYILTNDHVVDGADEIKVTFEKDKTEYTAKVIGRDPKTDIAVLKIDAKDLPASTLGDSETLEVGDRVMAVGNPFGIGQTVTMGIVSALGRGGMGIEDYEDFIQTDASINPGNSGGALVDMEGRLVGINTAILSRSGGNQGLGFAVPVNLVRHVMDELVKSGKVSRGYLGVMIQDVTPDLAKNFNLKETTGALVSEVTENSAAGEAGLKPGDVIIEFNGKQIRDGRSLRNNAGLLSPGTKTDVKVLRDGKERTFKVALRELPGEKATASNGSASEGSEEVLAGVGVGDLTADVRQQLKLPAYVKGAIITEVTPGSAAYDAGLREGDVVQEINRKPITGAEDAVKATSNVKERLTLVRVWSKGGSRFMVVDETKQK